MTRWSTDAHRRDPSIVSSNLTDPTFSRQVPIPRRSSSHALCLFLSRNLRLFGSSFVPEPPGLTPSIAQIPCTHSDASFSMSVIPSLFTGPVPTFPVRTESPGTARYEPRAASCSRPAPRSWGTLTDAPVTPGIGHAVLKHRPRSGRARAPPRVAAPGSGRSWSARRTLACRCGRRQQGGEKDLGAPGHRSRTGAAGIP